METEQSKSQQQPAAPETGGGLAAPTLLGVRRRLENGTAIVEDEGIGVRVWLKPSGEGTAESMGARRESMLIHAGRIDAMIDEARAMLSPNGRRELPPPTNQKGDDGN